MFTAAPMRVPISLAVAKTLVSSTRFFASSAFAASIVADLTDPQA
jgi:hypothetical protein